MWVLEIVPKETLNLTLKWSLNKHIKSMQSNLSPWFTIIRSIFLMKNNSEASKFLCDCLCPGDMWWRALRLSYLGTIPKGSEHVRGACDKRVNNYKYTWLVTSVKKGTVYWSGCESNERITLPEERQQYLAVPEGQGYHWALQARLDNL